MKLHDTERPVIIDEVNHALHKAGPSVRLRLVQEVDFRRSEKTNFLTLKKQQPKLVASLRRHDAVLFLSRKRDQMVFVYGFQTFQSQDHRGNPVNVEVLASARYRVSGGRWSPYMLADYAAAAGLELKGLKKFADIYRKLVA